VRDLASRLVADGHEALVVAGSTGALTEALVESGVPTVVCAGLLREIHPWHDARAVAALVGIIRRFRPNLITTHSSKAGMVGRLAAAVTGTPCLYTVHGWAFNDGSAASRRALCRWLERATAPLAARIICVSEHDRRIGAAAGIRPWRLVTIHNGIPDVSSSLRAEPGKPGPVRVVMVARFAPPKDHSTLLHAVRDVEDVELDLVGDGPAQPAAEALARELGIENRVHFLGRRADVAEMLARAHLLVLTSLSEGFPLSTLEAMRAGLPVVISAVGGAPEAVEEGVTGFLVGRGDVAGLRDRLAALARDRELRDRLGQAARARYEARYTFDRMYGATLDVYGAVAPAAGERATAAAR
jgi:glycosyltransferase involved in cell wall biosynthesis